MSLHCFNVRFPCGYGALSPASLSLVKTKEGFVDVKIGKTTCQVYVSCVLAQDKVT